MRPHIRSRSDWIESDHDLILLFEHDLRANASRLSRGKTGPHFSGSAPGPRLQDQVERRFGSATESRQATLIGHLAKPRLAGLRAERHADFLIERSGRADHGGSRIVNTPDRIEIILKTITGKRL